MKVSDWLHLQFHTVYFHPRTFFLFLYSQKLFSKDSVLFFATETNKRIWHHIYYPSNSITRRYNTLITGGKTRHYLTQPASPVLRIRINKANNCIKFDLRSFSYCQGLFNARFTYKSTFSLRFSSTERREKEMSRDSRIVKLFTVRRPNGKDLSLATPKRQSQVGNRWSLGRVNGVGYGWVSLRRGQAYKS